MDEAEGTDWSEEVDRDEEGRLGAEEDEGVAKTKEEEPEGMVEAEAVETEDVTEVRIKGVDDGGTGHRPEINNTH
jgi:hypothetical protein